MKTNIKNLLLLPALIIGLGLIPAGRVAAQTFTTLHSFTAITCEFCPNSDGALPNAGLITNLAGNTLYGTAPYGGSSGYGAVFAVNTDGSGFTNLHSFNYNEGTTPYAGLLLLGNKLYGTAQGGGSSGRGSVFAVNTDGSGFTNLHTFTGGGDGANPRAELILSGNTLYGAAAGGGLGNKGTVFAVKINGSGFTNLHSFAGGSEGSNPQGRLVFSSNTLYGTTVSGGSPGYGTVFAVNTNGTGFTNLHIFTGGSDGSSPIAGLILSGNTLYGAASYGGSPGGGTLFKVNTDGTGFTKLHSFNYDYDGINPGDLILSGNTLYGLATFGGSSGSGTVFAINTNGTGFKNLYNFTATSGPDSTNSDGATPQSGLVLSGNTLYGTAQNGGNSGGGTMFSLSLPPLLLTIIPYGGNVILSWPADAVGVDNTAFTLQSSTNLVSPVVWSTVSPGPVVFGGQNVVINPISGPKKYYRLSQ